MKECKNCSDNKLRLEHKNKCFWIAIGLVLFTLVGSAIFYFSLTKETIENCELFNNLANATNTESGLLERCMGYEEGYFQRITPLDCLCYSSISRKGCL